MIEQTVGGIKLEQNLDLVIQDTLKIHMYRKGNSYHETLDVQLHMLKFRR